MGNPSLKLPEPDPITVDVKKTALLVLDGSQRWSDPEAALPQVSSRNGQVPGEGSKGGNTGHILNFSLVQGKTGGRSLSEPVIYPDGFDKFTNGELQGYMKLYDVDTLIITGYRSHISVLNTATKATRELKYKVIIPIDGIAAKTEYEQEYTLFHFTVLPNQAAYLFSFKTLDMIDFR